MTNYNMPPNRILTADEILEMEFPDIEWVVQDLLPPGLTFLAGPPKVGKSWISLSLAHAIGTGDTFLGQPVSGGNVFYMALEDPPRRLKKRMEIQNWGTGVSVSFLTVGNFHGLFGDLGTNGIFKLANLIDEEDYKVVIIDTFSRAFRQKQNEVEQITEALSPLQEVAHGKNCAVIMIDHHRKTKGKDEIDVITDILGSTAKGAMADNIWGLYRKRGSSNAQLAVSGREIQERLLTLDFDGQNGMWRLATDINGRTITDKEQEILDLLKNSEGELQQKKIAELLGADKGNNHRVLEEMVNKGLLLRTKDEKRVFYSIVKG